MENKIVYDTDKDDDDDEDVSRADRSGEFDK